MKALFAAMALAFPEIEGALKDSDNPAFKSGGKAIRYADLSSVVNAIKPALAKHKLFFVQMTHEQTGGVCIETIVGHSEGDQFSFGKLYVPAAKNDAQGYGSALTYARRYSLMTAFGVCPEDDDGNAAAASAPRQQQQDQQSRQQQDQRPRISPAQELELEDLIRDAGVDRAAFLSKGGISETRDMRPDQFGPAKQMLNSIIDRKAEQQQRQQHSEDLMDEVPYQ